MFEHLILCEVDVGSSLIVLLNCLSAGSSMCLLPLYFCTVDVVESTLKA